MIVNLVRQVARGPHTVRYVDVEGPATVSGAGELASSITHSLAAFTASLTSELQLFVRAISITARNEHCLAHRSW